MEATFYNTTRLKIPFKSSVERYTNNFQESLILLKDLLCWDYQDITNLKLNARQKSVVIFINILATKL